MASAGDATGTHDHAGTTGRAELERIIESDVFVGSERMRRLLRFIVERTLDGRGDEIKEYVLGTEVFDRGTSYDPRLDSIVRVEARRLRAKLDEYYAGPGASDPVRIRLRPGSYVPLFESRPTGGEAIGGPIVHPDPPFETPASRGRRGLWISAGLLAAMIGTVAFLAWRPTEPARADGAHPRLAVLPVSHYPPGAESAALAERITDGVTSELVRIGRLEIVSRTSARQFAAEPRSVRVIADALNADWLVEATVHTEPGRVRVDARLVDPRRDRKVWAGEFVGSSDDLIDLERRIAAAIDAAVQRAGP